MSEEKGTCSYCRFFASNSAASELGQCRRQAPKRNDAIDYDGDSWSAADLWPVLHEDCWCGEFQPIPPDEGIRFA